GLGGLVFFDAYPLEAGERGLVEGDVLTPHYRAGGRLVSELDAGPTPVVGFSLAPGVRFRFVVGVDWWRLRRRLERAGCAGLQADAVAGVVGASLVYALERVGLGGKSTRGYGFFEVEDYSVERCDG
ncbi:MAG: hypothetical protein GXO15_00880, partial [Crenarchaeota archaeon]|nr:hypothetical protein [Thermoproteota archaeon]